MASGSEKLRKSPYQVLHATLAMSPGLSFLIMLICASAVPRLIKVSQREAAPVNKQTQVSGCSSLWTNV